MGHSGISTLAKSELYVQIKILIVFKIRPYSIKKENEFLDKILCFRRINSLLITAKLFIIQPVQI